MKLKKSSEEMIIHEGNKILLLSDIIYQNFGGGERQNMLVNNIYLKHGKKIETIIEKGD